MSYLSTAEILSHDIDWFCSIKGRAVHIASMAGFIPKPFADREILNTHQKIIFNLPLTSSIRLRTQDITARTQGLYDYIDKNGLREWIETLNSNDSNFTFLSNYPLEIRLFASTFAAMSRRGFYSYARIGNSQQYFLVSEPLSPLQLNQEQLALKTLFSGDGDMPETFEIFRH